MPTAVQGFKEFTSLKSAISSVGAWKFVCRVLLMNTHFANFGPQGSAVGGEEALSLNPTPLTFKP